MSSVCCRSADAAEPGLVPVQWSLRLCSTARLPQTAVLFTVRQAHISQCRSTHCQCHGQSVDAVSLYLYLMLYAFASISLFTDLLIKLWRNFCETFRKDALDVQKSFGFSDWCDLVYSCLIYIYEGRSINKLQNGDIPLIFKI